MILNSFVESAQIVGETFGACLEDMRETTLECLLPAVRKVFVDWLSAVVCVLVMVNLQCLHSGLTVAH